MGPLVFSKTNEQSVDISITTNSYFVGWGEDVGGVSARNAGSAPSP